SAATLRPGPEIPHHQTETYVRKEDSDASFYPLTPPSAGRPSWPFLPPRPFPRACLRGVHTPHLPCTAGRAPASTARAPRRVRHRAQPGGTGPGPASELRDLVRRVHTIILGGLIHRNGRGQNPGRAAGLPVGTIPASLPPSLALTQPPPGRGEGMGS